MTLSLNQFALQAIQGQMDLRFNTNIISCEIDSTSAGGLGPGQAVKLVASAGTGNSVPHVVECAASSDAVFGFIVYNIKNQTFNALDKVEIAFAHDSIMYMTSSAAITQGANVSIVVSGSKVATAVGSSGTTIVGQAFDGAAAANQVVRVKINLPGTAA